ncbi:hypothetical protein BDV97DRAFT_295949 [Delphinella strobiligena]|nr:hypothetical protein BDV97DRAFT_295949 [Delphinella strobiligena]
MDIQDPIAELHALSKRKVKTWIYWYVDNSGMQRVSSLLVAMRFWRQAYRLQLRRDMPIELASEMKNTGIRTEFELAEDQKDKPVVNVDDLLCLLHHHWVQCTNVYPTERHRVQQALLMLLCAYTSARPDAFQVSCTDPDARRDSLKYKDINIFKVRDPSRPAATMLVMIVRLRLHKGTRHAGAAPCYILYERDDNLAFCPILHVLALAFADRAFKSDWLSSPCDLDSIQVPEFLMSVPLEWKDEMKEIPLLRKSCRTSYGVECSPNAGLPYAIANMHTIRLGQSAGFKQSFNLYSLRRGAGEAIDKVATAAERNRAMGHSRSEIFDKYYVNQTINVDLSSAYLGTPSRDAIVRLASHMSLTRDPRVHAAISSVPEAQEDSDPILIKLKQEMGDRRFNIIANYGSINKAKGTDSHKDYTRIQHAVRARKKKFSRDQREGRREDWFDNLGCNEIERQRKGLEPQHLPETPTLVLQERKQLADTLFRNEDVNTRSEHTVRADRSRALKAMIGLCARREVRQRQISSAEDDKQLEANIGVCHGLQCPWCFANPSFCQETRIYMFSRIDALRKHVDKQHVDQVIDTDVCPYAGCEFVFDAGQEKLKHHMASCHGLCLRARSHELDSLFC